VAAERYLGNAVLLTHQGYGHLFFQNPSDCVNEAMADYLTELATPPRAPSASPNTSPSIPTSAAAKSTSTAREGPERCGAYHAHQALDQGGLPPPPAQPRRGQPGCGADQGQGQGECQYAYEHAGRADEEIARVADRVVE
jgi:hypothetical protein